MVCLCWLLVVVVVVINVCVPGSVSICWDNSICYNLRNKEKILDCVHLCLSVIQTEIPELRALTLGVNDDVTDDLLHSVILPPSSSEDDDYLAVHNDVRRANSMQNSQWSQPLGLRVGPKMRSHINHRRSYSMEHFRWGKPYGRKRRPVKVFVSALEGGGSSEGLFPAQVRWQRSLVEDDTNRNAILGDPHQGFLKLKASIRSKSQQRRNQNYRMNHFRWGDLASSKRHLMFGKQWEEKPQRPQGKIYRNIIDVQRIVGRVDD
ncbi:pro-opiomelanocortin-1-like [Gouania willdenowi]|uniref:pro-opiomelanocortin-1-like n=1 Tax=Gouania willdenowi TaxID=441366 RepID=UPI001056746E|nr:pro-opiomelanocortin-1-like [Gouania willdenowi]